ncbi:MAG: hypothetical protein APF76_08010 [Desulfitibacter sp. BRH_c19]|nr:MAG: hypothetical protein APF76_08010 [Desulfitibacter sp. BRH_c19]
MDRLQIGLGQNSYDIILASSAISEIIPHIENLHDTKKCCIVSQNNIFKYHGLELFKILKSLGYDVNIHIVPDGEKAKSIKYCRNLFDFLLAKNYDRHSLLIALGGGVVGDLTGFVAATYMRGIPYIQIPTTLLSAVDSSVGGKTGINFGGIKNIVGAFYQPKLVFINTEFLKTLPEAEFKAGLGEVIKYGILDGKNFFNELSEKVNIINPTYEGLPALIKSCCEIKARIVEEDEKELTGSRMLLNLGHTMGHSIEVLTGLRHGEAVGVGIVYVAKLSKNLGYLKKDEAKRIIDLIKKSGLPWEIPTCINQQSLLELIEKDKKQIRGKVNWVILHGVGDVRIHSLANSEIPII